MIAYGEKKRRDKLHDYDKCSICAEKTILKKTARQDARREIRKELNEMLKVTEEDSIRTNHVMVPDKRKRIYCKLVNKVIKWSDEFYQEQCVSCQYLNGLGQNVGAIECAFIDDSENITEIVEDPFEFVESGFKLGFRKAKVTE